MATISIIAAISENLAIGKSGKLLWDIPEDLKFFKKVTEGHPVIMGRKTFESMGSKPLSNRINIVITRNKNWFQKGVYTASSLEAAIKLAKKLEQEEIFIIGGASVYEEAIKNFADYLYITLVHSSYPKADTWFPKISDRKWKVVKEKEPLKSAKGVRYSFFEYTRV